MWHETEEEQLEMLKSLFRIDSDSHRRRMAREHLKVGLYPLLATILNGATGRLYSSSEYRGHISSPAQGVSNQR